MESTEAQTPLPLADIKVIELASVIAGPGCARYLGDYGADVIKVERPGSPDSTRDLGWRDPDDGETFWWKLVGRNKRCIELDLKSTEGRDTLLRLAETADVLIENFRPGKLDALGLTADVLHQHQPNLVITRVSGFGQTGPYAQRPGFATIAEAMSGFAAINGTAEGGPTLPPIALTDEVTALVAAFATMVALHSGVGQEVDANLLESMFHIMGPLFTAHVTLGVEQQRMGSELPYSVPRNTYQCADGKWIALSASSNTVGPRAIALVGLNPDDYATFADRVAGRDAINAAMRTFAASRTADDVVESFRAAEASCAHVFDMADIAADPHYADRGTVSTIDGTPMQGMVAALSRTPGRVRFPARSTGADTDAVLAELDQLGDR